MTGKESRKRIKGLGMCNTMVFAPQMIIGEVFTEEDGMQVWVSDDQNKIPLMIESPISVGSVKVILSKWTGLKYPLDLKPE